MIAAPARDASAVCHALDWPRIVMWEWICPALLAALFIGVVVTNRRFQLGSQGKSYDKIGDLITDVSAMTGLAGDRSQEGAWFPQVDRLRFEGKLPTGRRARLSFRQETHGSSTTTYGRFVVDADDAASLTITREGLDDKLLKWLGWKSEIEIGDPSFDERFLIQPSKNGEAGARKALARGLTTCVRECFDRYRAEAFLVANGELSIEIPIDALAPDAYRVVLATLDEAASFFDRVPIKVRGFAGMKRAFRSASGALRCAYCHDGISGDEPDLVACPRCATALHDHCWAEHGRCPVLGCTAIQPERAQQR
jgi:hypothetical protein